MTGMATLIVFVLVCLALLFQIRSKSLKDFLQTTQSLAYDHGDRLAQKINGSADALRAYSTSVAQLAASELIPDEKKREYILESMEYLIQNENKLKNLWLMFEPYALDGLDSIFVDQRGSNSQGVFAPWYIGGKITAREKFIDPELYQIPQKTKKQGSWEYKSLMKSNFWL